MNYMAEVAKLLGVELGEEFEIKGGSDFKCTIYNDGLYVYPAKDDLCSLPSSEQVLSRLLEGAITIKRKPWKPQDNEKFYVVTSNWGIMQKFWDDCSTCKNYYKLGNLYKTEEEAEANREKWIAFYASDEVLEV